VFAASASLRTADLKKNDALKNRIIQHYQQLLTPNSIFISERSHVDHNVQAVLPFTIYNLTGNKMYLDLGLKYARSQWAKTGPDGLTDQARWWVDDMYMIGILQLSAYRITGEKNFLDNASKTIAAYLPKLQQSNGLFLHGPGAPFYWCRGNGWVAAILAEILTDLPATDPNYASILNGYKRMMEALINYQSDNGMWRQLIDYPYSWAESSGTAMFAFAMTRGVNLGILKDKKFSISIDKAYNTVIAHVNNQGRIREVCVGTNKMPDRDFYLERPRVVGDYHGQAPLLWLINERLSKD
jgi:rhamnogalacturonyl hydrolase YesR